MRVKSRLLMTVAMILAFAATALPIRAESSSDSERLEKLEKAVQALQDRNAQLEAEVKKLKKTASTRPATLAPPAEGPTKSVANYDGKSSVEKSVPIEESGSKWKLSTPLTELELFGDIRLRYEYRAGQTVDALVRSPGPDDWLERERERYRIRFGFKGQLADDWFFGLRLETSQNPRSTNVTFGDDTSEQCYSQTNNEPFTRRPATGSTLGRRIWVTKVSPTRC